MDWTSFSTAPCQHNTTEPLNLVEALEILAGLAKKRALIVPDPTAKFIIQLAEIEISSNKKTAHLLFLHIDKNKAEAVYGHIKNLTLRQVAKRPEEGGAVTAHLVIALDEDADGRHRAALEEVEGLSRSTVIPYLRTLIQNNIIFHVKSPSGKISSVNPTLSVLIENDRPLSEQLANVRLIAVDLRRASSKSTIDRADIYYEKERIVRFRPVGRVRGRGAVSIINDILGRTDTAGFNDVRIRVVENSGRERTVNANRAKEDTLSGAFQRKTLIADLDPPLPEASASLEKHLIAKMIDAILK